MNDRNVPRRRVPRSVVVSIRGIEEGFSYADAMRKAKEGISLKDLGINNTRIKKAAGGSLLIEVPGPNGDVHADKLKNELVRVLGDAAVVTRPVVRGDFRVIGVDESVTSKEVAMVMAEVGGCLAEEVTVSPMRPMKNGLYMVWVKLPLTTAIKVSSRRRLKVGWTTARIEFLDTRPIQCYKCWAFGHI